MLGLSDVELTFIWVAAIAAIGVGWILIPEIRKRRAVKAAERRQWMPPVQRRGSRPRRTGRIYLSDCAPLRREVIDEYTAHMETVKSEPLSEDEAAIIYELGRAAERARRNGGPGA